MELSPPFHCVCCIFCLFYATFFWEDLKFCCIFYLFYATSSASAPGGVGGKFLEPVAFFIDSRNRPRNSPPQDSPRGCAARNRFSKFTFDQNFNRPYPLSDAQLAPVECTFLLQNFTHSQKFFPSSPKFFQTPQSVKAPEKQRQYPRHPPVNHHHPETPLLRVVPIAPLRPPPPVPEMLQIPWKCNIFKNFLFAPTN